MSPLSRHTGTKKLYKIAGRNKVMKSNWCLSGVGDAACDDSLAGPLQTDVTGLLFRGRDGVGCCHDCADQEWPEGGPVYLLFKFGSCAGLTYAGPLYPSPTFGIFLSWNVGAGLWQIKVFCIVAALGTLTMGIWIKGGSSPLGTYRIACADTPCEVCLTELVVSEP